MRLVSSSVAALDAREQLFHLTAALICSASYFILIPAQIEAGGGQTTPWFLGFGKIAATQRVKDFLGGSSQKSCRFS